MSKKTKKAVLIGLGTALLYSAVKGNGIFNKPRFYFVYKALEKYLSSNHADSNIGEIVKTKNGWSCIVNDKGKSFVVNISKAVDGNYLFSESELKEDNL